MTFQVAHNSYNFPRINTRILDNFPLVRFKYTQLSLI